MSHWGVSIIATRIISTDTYSNKLFMTSGFHPIPNQRGRHLVEDSAWWGLHPGGAGVEARKEIPNLL